MKRTLVLGAGLVSRPMVSYLLSLPDFEVWVGTRTVAKAEELVGRHPRGKAIPLLVDDEAVLDRFVAQTDIVVSLLPYTYHVKVAGLCLKHRRPLVTTSYVSDAMRRLDQEARAAGVLLLNEIGLDPGIDHMSAMRVIHLVQQAGGRVTSFMSYCGGLPAPEANDNPLGYKFSWSPKGVVMAGRNDARYLKDGKEVFVPGNALFGHRWPLKVADGYEFEAYPNRNSLPYIELYGLTGISTMLRGTLRNFGWCETMKAIADLGILKDETVRTGLANMTYAQWFSEYAEGRGGAARKLGLPEEDAVLERLAWLGLFDNRPIGIDQGSNLDILARAMLEKMAYKPGERDMIVLHHEFVAEYPDRPREKLYSTLIDFGVPNGDSAMARTVSLPAAIAVRMILEGRLNLTGVHIPVLPEIYEPV
ncbi:MAG: saccharopine dehydrogenase C-terminal domain-containing protein, partial [candidate division WOR-3 bacterium]